MRIARMTLDKGSEAARALAVEIRALAPQAPEVAEIVKEVLAEVRLGGDSAVLAFTRRFDSASAPDALRVPPEALERALDALDPDVREALDVAVANVRHVSEAELAGSVSVALDQGQRVELRELPVRRAAAYVPGGRAAYPSTVVMCAVPAKVAGVERLVVATPPGPDGGPHPVTLAACALCEVDEVYAMGGAQAIAALALGSDSVEPVDLIVGPGNQYVQEAKRQVFGAVGIDGIYGPSELVVVADETADPTLVALDVGAQAEHGDDSLFALLSPSKELLDAVESELERLDAERATIADPPVALVATASLDAAVALADAVAPEHLELACAEPERIAAREPAGGCVFLGASAGAAFGDYAAGSNHVLPTGGAARFAGPLGVARFRRRQALVSLSAAATEALAPHVGTLARAEGFPVHGESAEARPGRGHGEPDASRPSATLGEPK